MICGIDLNDDEYTIVSLIPSLWCDYHYIKNNNCPKGCLYVEIDPQDAENDLNLSSFKPTFVQSLVSVSQSSHHLTSRFDEVNFDKAMIDISSENEKIGICTVGKCWRVSDDKTKPCPEGCFFEEENCVQQCSKEYVVVNNATCIKPVCDVPVNYSSELLLCPTVFIDILFHFFFLIFCY
jgi:hypothetical protein